ncbi:MAG: hypothetical protein RL377_844, partial [Bacteroidota bacterium]
GGASIQLSKEDLANIENAATKITIQGARYPQSLQNRVGK